jgi:hypothetical protein
VIPAEAEETFNHAFSPVTVSLVTFDPASFTSQASVFPQEVQKTYTEEAAIHPAWTSKERRTVSYVSFLLTSQEQKLPVAEKQKRKHSLAEKALAFASGLDQGNESPDQSTSRFIQLARKKNEIVQKTNSFAADESPASLQPSPHFNQAAFHLTVDRPDSDPVETEQGFYVLHLERIDPSVPRPLKEIQDLIVQELNNRKATAMAMETGMKSAQAIKAAMDKGASFKQAAADLHLKTETLPPLVPGDPRASGDPRLQLIRALSMALPLHGTSGFLPTDRGGFIVSLEARGAPDHLKYDSHRDQLRSTLEKHSKEQALEEWVQLKNRAKGTQEPVDFLKER